MGVDYYTCEECDEVVCYDNGDRCRCERFYCDDCVSTMENRYGKKHNEQNPNCEDCKNFEKEWLKKNKYKSILDADYDKLMEEAPECEEGGIWRCKLCDPERKQKCKCVKCDYYKKNGL